MKILVTGGAGYVGSILVPILLQNGHQVKVLDSFMYNQASLLDCCADKKLSIVRGDVRDEKVMAECMKEADAIIPLACIVGAPACDLKPIEARQVNLDAIKGMLSLRSKDQIWLYPDTNSGYGRSDKGDSGELKYCTEGTPLNPISLYGKLKVCAENEIMDAGNAITLRLATVFGISPRPRLDLLVNDFVYQAVSKGYIVFYDGRYKRNYIHIRDVARAFLYCLDNFKRMKDNVYNLGLSDANLSVLELCQEIKKQIPNLFYCEASSMTDPDARNYVVDNSKIEATGFKPMYSLQDGIVELIKGYQVVRRNHFSNI